MLCFVTLFPYSIFWLLVYPVIVLCTSLHFAFAKSSGVHDTGFRGHTSKCYSVCSLSQSQSTVPALYPFHLRKFFFIRATPALNLLSVFQMFHSLWYPSGSILIGLNLKLLVWCNAIHLQCSSCSSNVVISLVDFSLLRAGRCP